MYRRYRSLNSNLRVTSTIVMPLSDVAVYIKMKASFCFLGISITFRCLRCFQGVLR